MSRPVVIAVALVLGALVAAAPASAANRFASPNGDDSSPSCPVSDPCSIETAINDANAVNGDDVTLLGGLPPDAYVVDATQLSIPGTVTVHGTAGSRPVIETAFASGDAVTLDVGSVLRDVIVKWSGVNDAAINLQGGGTLLRVTSQVTLDAGTASSACKAEGAGSMVIQDSVCWFGDDDGGSGASGAVEAINSAASQTLTLRNVTAVASAASLGNEVPGIVVNAFGTGDIAVKATNVIAQDLSPTGSDVRVFDGSVTFDHSNYDSEDDPGTDITDPGTGTGNQTSAPAFANSAIGDFRQTSASTGTIDLGVSGLVNGVDLGTFDFEGGPRVVGSAPDIGADERPPPATTPPPAGGGAPPVVVPPATPVAPKKKKCKKKHKRSAQSAKKKCKKRKR